MPSIRDLIRADGIRFIVLIHRIDRQGEVHGAVATILGLDHALVGLRACSGRGHLEAVGGVGFAQTDFSREVGGGELMNGEIQDHHTIATVGGLEILGIETGSIRIESVGCVGYAVADMRHDGVTILSRHGEVQRHRAVATVYRLQVGRVGTRLVQGLSIEVIGSRGADGRVDDGVLHRVHRQGQGRRAVATQSVQAVMRQRVGSRHHGRGVETITLIARACTNLVLISDFARRVDRDDQRHKTVATVRGDLVEHHIVCTRLVIRGVLTILGISSSLADSICKGNRIINRINGDLDFTSRALAGGRLIVVADEIAAGGGNSTRIGRSHRSGGRVILIPTEGGARCGGYIRFKLEGIGTAVLGIDCHRSSRNRVHRGRDNLTGAVATRGGIVGIHIVVGGILDICRVRITCIER